ncbi:C-type lectin domain family 4 member M-like isoform X1 [Drosophila grimshawi]|uniref:C-type lectin domain family 4 member M-like isoform X1 n=1 Tax=Drosophila grimshawi TaxID=7222 RepID=UPI000C86FA76|nr:C-type lectin domain family 4 member M-like isoform X1 [Drosophila grimshawi]
MQIILVTLLISVPPLLGVSSTCEKDAQLENTCGKFCFKVVKPILGHMAALQIKTIDQEDKEKSVLQSKLDNIEKELKQVKVDKDNCPDQSELLKQNADLQSKLENMENELVLLHKIDDEHDQKLEEQTFKCQPELFKKIGSKYYYIEDQVKKNWYAAVHRCHQLGAHLVSVQNQTEYDAIIAKLSPHKRYWIDVNDLSEEGKYISHTTGIGAAFLNWYPAFNPDNYGGNEDCGSFWYVGNRYGMNDFNCFCKCNFICETFNLK